MDIKVQAMGEYQTNCYIVTIDGKDLIIDPGVGAMPWIKKNVSNPIAVLNTHGHFDHIWSNQEVKDRYNILLYTPKDDEFMLSLDSYGMGMPPSKADVLVKPDEQITIQDIKITFHHFPGHTPGCSMIQIQNCLFSGDFLFKGTIGRYDFPYSNENDMKKSLEKIITWNENFEVYPGHGAKTTLQNEMSMLKQWLNFI